MLVRTLVLMIYGDRGPVGHRMVRGLVSSGMRFRALMNVPKSRIARRTLDRNCEIVLNVDQRLAPDTARQLRQNGTKVASWFPDAVLNMGRHLMLLAPYDAIFFV